MSFINDIPLSEKSSVCVAVRIRPLNTRELESRSITSVKDNSIYIINPDDHKKKIFTYDYVYDTDTHQELIYMDIGKHVINNAFKGYNSCIFAYGLTGSGKTYTMMGGTDSNGSVAPIGSSNQIDGLIPRICKDLFLRQTDHNGTAPGDCRISYQVEVSYLEIYSEQVRDLMNPQKNEKNLKVRQHPVYGPYVEGLTQLLVEDFKSVKRIIDKGNKERHTASTLMNNRSSRSHAILTIYFTQIVEETTLGRVREVVSKINLVDLAGSERVEASGVSGINLKEAIVINKSLSTLGLVISKLAMKAQKQASKSPIHKNRSNCGSPPGLTHMRSSSKSQHPLRSPSQSPPRLSSNTTQTVSTPPKFIRSKSSQSVDKDHVPFRDSVLTWILKESLGGNSKTYMIATISPSAMHYNESLNTLRYASNAKQIVNIVKINEDPNDKIISVLKNEIKQLRSKLINNSLGIKGVKSLDSDEIKRLNEEIEQREALMKEKEKSWKQKLEESRKISDEIQQQLRNELAIKQAEFKNKIQSMNEERDALLTEMEAIKSSMTERELLQQKTIEDELTKAHDNYKKMQSEFEKGRLVETAVSLHEYYEKKLIEIQNQYRKNNPINKELEQLKSANKELQDSLQKTRDMLQSQLKQFTNERAMFIKQIQQLQAKVHILETTDLND